MNALLTEKHPQAILGQCRGLKWHESNGLLLKAVGCALFMLKSGNHWVPIAGTKQLDEPTTFERAKQICEDFYNRRD